MPRSALAVHVGTLVPLATYAFQATSRAVPVRSLVCSVLTCVLHAALRLFVLLVLLATKTMQVSTLPIVLRVPVDSPPTDKILQSAPKILEIGYYKFINDLK